MNAALSGLQAESLRIQNSAHNTANLNTERFRPSRVEATAREGGGVQAEIAPPPQEAAGAASDNRPSETDLVAEVVTAKQAAIGYTANLKMVSVASDLQGTLFDTKM